MKKTVNQCNPLILLALLATIVTGASQDPPRSGIYGIQSGLFREVGGYEGTYNLPLPASSQAFVSLTVPEAGPAQLAFLDNKQQPAYVPLTNGTVSSNTIRFQYQTVQPYPPFLPAKLDYTVSNSAGHLWISGSITSAPVCCDIIYLFQHQNVSATFLPALTIRVDSAVELYWSSASNQNCQLQGLSEFSQNTWTNLGGPIQGNGNTNSLIDTAAPAQSPRFYRIQTQ